MSESELKGSDYLTPQEVAAILRVSVDVVYRMFEDVPGVIILAKQKHLRARPYRTMRIPRSALGYYAK